MVRLATKDDVATLEIIHEAVTLNRTKIDDPIYAEAIQRKGFMLGNDSPHAIEHEIEQAYCAVVCERNGNIVGYSFADVRIEQKFSDDEYKTWFDLKLKDLYYNDPKIITLADVVVHPDFAGQGIATEMLGFVADKLKTEQFTHLFSIVTIAPLTNTASLLWHTKRGFHRLSMGRPRRLFELDNYAGLLLYKKL
ncbi:MAG TPA: GNAT family N-acetyltransferase [Candidatus Saccharimonadia bacterium]|nr:GNAT family N-acetyltransferase [Candidatus Saccharimonadia bacterium]